MFRVRIKDADGEFQRVDLRVGANRFGRSPANDLQIHHSTVSSTHCEILVEKDSIRIRDLGSTNGTFVNGQRINEGSLKAGESFYLGSVELMLEEGTASVSNLNLATVCLRHPRVAATAACPKCDLSFCDYCVTTRVVAGLMKKLCRRCGGECHLMNVDPTAYQTDDARAFSLLANALGYPLRQGNWMLLLGGALLVFLIDVATAGLTQGTPATAAFALLIAALGCGYFFSFLQRIITTTTLGEEQMPGWPDFTEVWQDMIQPFRLLWGLFAACFGPALVCWYFAHNGSDLAQRALWPLVIAGFLYLPMALLGVAMSDSLASLNPLFVLGSICKVPGQYLIACGLLAAIVGLKWAIEVALERIVPIFFLRYLFSSVLLLYFLIVEMRVLGLMYFWNRRKLGWA